MLVTQRTFPFTTHSKYFPGKNRIQHLPFANFKFASFVLNLSLKSLDYTNSYNKFDKIFLS